MIQEKEIEINGHNFTISKLPATVGREVMIKYPTSLIPKIGDYAQSEEIMLKLLSYVGAKRQDGTLIQLNTKALIDNFVPDAITLAFIEKEMIKYNFDFFQTTDASNFLNKFQAVALDKATEILTGLLGRLSQTEKQPSTN